MSISSAEKAVRIARRRKKRALPGYRLERAFDLKRAVTAALAASSATGEGSSLRRCAATDVRAETLSNR